MGFTGFLMWNPVTAAKFFPGEFIPAAKAAHGGEALLAVLAIIVWHMYGVHIKQFNKAMWTGRLTEDEMLHEHPLELADIKAGVADRPVDALTLRKRQRIYFPVAAILTVVMLVGVYGFTTAENTALTTIPPQPESMDVFVPQTPTPIPTPVPTFTPTPKPPTPAATSSANPTWNGAIGALFAEKCTGCHGGTDPAAGLNLSSYSTAIQGGVNGPFFIAGDSANSSIITKFTSGGHPYATLLEEELALITEWINAGAVEE
jgi:mono/diheme cytochrome c family protein